MGRSFHNPLKKGERYYVAFRQLKTAEDWEKWPQGVVAWWPEKKAPAELEKAILGELYKK